MAMTENYRMGLEYLSALYPEVDGFDFYREIFPRNENSGELFSDYSRPNAIFLYKDERDEGSGRRLRQRVMLSDMWEEDYEKYVKGNPMTLCSGAAFRGGRNTLANARQLNALVIDLDGAGAVEISRLFYYFERTHDLPFAMPLPTFLVLSGAGVHLYYVFEKSVALFPNIKIQMKRLKQSLINLLWIHGSTSQVEHRQYQGITQGFRMVGSVNSKYGTVVRAFRVGGKVSLEYLNQYVYDKENRVDVLKPYKPSKMTREEAAEKYPEWYQWRIVEGKKIPKKWSVKKDLYEWWKRQMRNEAIVGGRRYNFMMCMAAYAYKCDVSREQLEKDLQEAFEYLRTVKHDNELTRDDVISAIGAYDKKYYNMKIAEVERKTGMRIERNKRNGRKQDQHLRLARGQLSVLKEMGEATQGRPSAVAVVVEYRKKNPEAKPKECMLYTGLSKNTVYKWWKDERVGL